MFASSMSSRRQAQTDSDRQRAHDLPAHGACRRRARAGGPAPCRRRRVVLRPSPQERRLAVRDVSTGANTWPAARRTSTATAATRDAASPRLRDGRERSEPIGEVFIKSRVLPSMMVVDSVRERRVEARDQRCQAREHETC